MVAQRLFQLRKEAGLSQEKVARAIDTTLRQYQRFEHGEQKPGYQKLIDLANVFQVSLDYLVGRSETRDFVP